MHAQGDHGLPASASPGVRSIVIHGTSGIAAGVHGQPPHLAWLVCGAESESESELGMGPAEAES